MVNGRPHGPVSSAQLPGRAGDVVPARWHPAGRPAHPRRRPGPADNSGVPGPDAIHPR